MNKYLAGIVFGVCISLAGAAVAQVLKYSELEAANRARAGAAKAGTSTRITVTGTSASAGPLTANALYEIVCTEETYFEFGATAPTATSSSSLLPADTIIYRVIQDNVQYVAALRTTTSGTCYFTELQ